MTTQSCTLTPNGNGTFSGLWGGTGGTPTYSYTEIDEGFSPPSDTDYITCASDSASGFWLLSDCPSDWVTALTCTARIRAQDSGKGTPRDWNTIQIFKSDESTALTGTASLAASTSASWATFTASLTITGATDKTSWDGARVKLTSNSGGSGSAWLSALQIEMTYDDTAAPAYDPSTGTFNRVGTLEDAVHTVICKANKIEVQPY